MEQQEADGRTSIGKWNLEKRRRVIEMKRREIGLSRVRLARLANVHPSTVGQFEAGKIDVAPKTLAKIEEAISDAMAGFRTIQNLQAQRRQVGLLSEMTLPPVGTEEYWERREEFARHSSGRMTELENENIRLREQSAELNKMVNLLEKNVENLTELKDVYQKLNVIQGAALEEQE